MLSGVIAGLEAGIYRAGAYEISCARALLAVALCNRAGVLAAVLGCAGRASRNNRNTLDCVFYLRN
jgi:hypothetical protein